MFSKDYKKPDADTGKNAGDALPDSADTQGFRERMAARGAGRQPSTMAMLAGLDKDDNGVPADAPTRSLYNRDAPVTTAPRASALPDAAVHEAVIENVVAAADERPAQDDYASADPVTEAQDRLAESQNDTSALPVAATAMGADGLRRSGGGGNGGGGDEREGGSRLGDISQFAFAGLAVLGLAGLSVLAAESALKGQPDDGDASSDDLDIADGGAGGVVTPQGDASTVALAAAAPTSGEVQPWFDYRGTADRLAARKVKFEQAEKQVAATAATKIDATAASVIAESEASRLAEEARRAADTASATDKAALEEKARIAEAEARRLAEAAATKSAAENAERVALEEAEATRIAALDAQKQVEANQEAARLAKIKAAALADATAKAEAEAEVKRLAELEVKAKADAEAARIAEADAKARAVAETKRLAEVQAKEAEATRVAALKAKEAAAAEAKRLAALEADKVAKVEAQRLADLKIQKAADAEALRVANAATARKAEIEAKRLASVQAEKAAATESKRLAAVEAQKKQAARLAAAQKKRAAPQVAAVKPAPKPRPPIVFAAYNGAVPAPASSKPIRPRTTYASQTGSQTVRTYANNTTRSTGQSQNAAIVRTYPVSRTAPVQLTARSTSVRPFQRVGAAFQPSPRLAADFMSERVRRTQLKTYPGSNLTQFESEFLSVVAAQPDGTTRSMTTPDGRSLSVTFERSMSQKISMSGTRPLNYSGSGSNTVMSVTNPTSTLKVSVLCRDIAYAFAGQERGRFAACQSPDNPAVWNMARASEPMSGLNSVASNTNSAPVRSTTQLTPTKTSVVQDVTMNTLIAPSETTRHVSESYRAAPRVQPINFSLASTDAPTKKAHRYSTGPHKLQF